MGSSFEASTVISIINYFSNENFSTTLKSWNFKDLSDLAHAINKWPDATLNKHINARIVVAIKEKLSKGGTLNKQMLWSFAQLFIDRPDESWSCSLMQKIAAEFLSARFKDEKFTMHELCWLASGFSNWHDQECCDEAMQKISHLIQRDLPTADITEPQLSMFAVAFIEWSHKDWINDTMKMISDVAKQKVINGKRFTQEGLCFLACAFCKWPEREWSFEVVRMIAVCSVASFDAGFYFNKEELAPFATAFSKFADRNSTSIYAVMRYIYEDFKLKYIGSEKLTAKQLCELAFAFDKWPEETWSYELIERLSMDFDMTVFDSMDLYEQDKIDLAKLFRKYSGEKWSKADKFPFIHLAPKLHKKSSPLESLTKKFKSFRQIANKKVKVDL